MQLCSDNHAEIAFISGGTPSSRHGCPLCSSLQDLEDAKQEINDLNGDKEDMKAEIENLTDRIAA